MNKILPIILVLVLFGCTNMADRRIKQFSEYNNAIAKCERETATMVKYVHCVHKYRAQRNKYYMVDNIPWESSSSDSKELYIGQEGVRELEKKYSLVIAAEVDAGRATRIKGELEIAKLSKILFEEWNAKRGFVANQDFQKSLQFLDIYSKAIERTTPKPSTIIINE